MTTTEQLASGPTSAHDPAEIPDFTECLRQKSEAPGMSPRKLSIQAGLEEHRVATYLRGAEKPTAEAVRSLTACWDEVPASWVEAWTHWPTASANGGTTRALQQLSAIAEDMSKPQWSRWIAKRAVELNLSVRGLSRALGAKGHGHLAQIIQGKIAPQDSTLDDLAMILGPVPDGLREAARVGRSHDGRAPSYDTFRSHMRRWGKDRLVEKIKSVVWPLPADLKAELDSIPWTGQVGVAGFDLYMKATVVRMEARAAANAPSRPKTVRTFAPLGPSPRVSVGATLGRLNHGHSYFYQCSACHQLRWWAAADFREYVELSGGTPAICRPCYMKFSTTPAGYLWRTGRSGGQGAPPPIRLKSGPTVGPEELSRRMTWLLKSCLGEKLQDIAEQYDADPETVKKAVQSTRRLLDRSESPRLRRLAEAIRQVEQAKERGQRSEHG